MLFSRVQSIVRVSGFPQHHRQRVLFSSTTNDAATAEFTDGEKLLYSKLMASLSPHKLRVSDVSGGCGSMYAIDIASKAFEGVSMVKQHRMVNKVLAEDIKGMHGLQLKTSAK
ncbi:bola protein [Spinellus fusiger]|nr:bola protein [Spinellus fusiger]